MSKAEIQASVLLPGESVSATGQTDAHLQTVECYSDLTITRISIQTAGLAFGGTGLCSYRVKGVDGSCAKHLTVESYMVIYAANSYTYIISFSSPTLSFIPDLKPFFSANPFPLQPCFFFFGTDYMIPQTFTVISSISVFTF